MKQFISWILVMLMVLTLSGCENSSKALEVIEAQKGWSDAQKIEAAEAVDPSIEIRICVPCWDNSDAANTIEGLERIDDHVTGVRVHKIKDCDPSKFDGLLLPGGSADVQPSLYGQEVNGAKKMDSDLDDLQYAAVEAFVKAGKPIIGTCRGVQFLNVYFGGTLFQDIDGHNQTRHNVTNEPESTLALLYDTDTMEVNSFHHQAIDQLGEGLKAIQRSEDGIVEAIEHETLPVYGVQWHMEYHHEGDPLLHYYMQLCREYKVGVK